MKYLIPDYYKEFECIGSACTANCCLSQWKILVDDATVAKYKKLAGPFGDRLRGNLEDYKGQTVMKTTQRGGEYRCPFLAEDSLCEIYQQLGAEYQCDTCKVYPRNFCSVGDVRIVSLMVSCPEVVRILLEHTEPIEFLLEDISEPAGKDGAADTDWEYFNKMMRNFTASVTLMQDRRFSISDRLKMLVFFNEDFEKHIADKSSQPSFSDMLLKEDEVAKFVAGLQSFSRNVSNKLHAFLVFYRKADRDFLQNLPQICVEDLSDNERMEAFFEAFGAEYGVFLENYCISYLSRHYLAGNGERRTLEIIKFLIYMLNIHHYYLYFQTDGSMEQLSKEIFTDTFVKISRVIEHGNYEENLRICYPRKEKNDISYLLSLI